MHVVPLGEMSLRLPGAICSAAAPPLLYWLTRREVGRPAASAACIMLAFSSFCVFYAQEARFYAPLQLFAVVSAGLWIRLIARADAPPAATLYWLAGVNLIGSMIHMFGFVTAGFEWCVLFLMVPVFRTQVRFYVAGTISLVPYLVWLVVSYPHFSHLAGENFWITHLPLLGLISPARSLFAQPSVLLIFLLPFAFAGGALASNFGGVFQGVRGRIVLANVLVAVAVPLFAAVVSWTFTVIYLDKNLIVIFPFVYLAVAIVLVGCVEAAANRLLIGVFAIMLISLITFLVSGYPMRTATPYYQPYKEQVREAVGWVWQHAGPDDIVVLPADGPRDIPVYGFRIYTDYWHDPARMKQVQFVPVDAAGQVSQLAAIASRARAEHRNLFLYDNHEQHFVPEAVDAALRIGGCGVAHSFRATWVLAVYPDRPCSSDDLPAAGVIWPP
jgi:uncharacterized membrane protein